MMRLFNALLRLYPASFRQEYGDQMREAFEFRHRHGRGFSGAILGALAAIADVVPNAVAVHAALVAQDARHAWRGFGRSRLYTLGVVALLAIGVGANGAVYGILRAVLLNPLPYTDPSNIVMVWRAGFRERVGSMITGQI